MFGIKWYFSMEVSIGGGRVFHGKTWIQNVRRLQQSKSAAHNEYLPICNLSDLCVHQTTLYRWCFQIFFIFTPKIGEDFQFDDHIFQMGWFNKVSALWVTFCYPRFVNLSGVLFSPRPRVPIRCCTSLCHRFGLHLGPGPSNFPGAISFRWPDLGYLGLPL